MCTAHIIGKRIKEYRKKSKLSQLALAVEIGYDQGDLCKVENGKSIPTIPVLIRFADFFGLKLWAFLKEIDV
ncbi:MAG: helix-turn-helix transcriptional regulator [Clostridia bacterium]|nr:helix-turn-helix transcriptional regulator [Clostridia bacterium]